MSLYNTLKTLSPIFGVCIALLVPFFLFAQDIFEASYNVFAEPRAGEAYMFSAFALLAADPVLPTPSSLVATLLAAKVGFGAAAVTNAAGMTVACVLALWLGGAGREACERVGFSMSPRLRDWIERNGLVAILACRAVPVLAEASLILAGAGRVPRLRLVLWCTLANGALGSAYAFAGSGWNSGRFDPVAIATGAAALPLMMAGFVMLMARRTAAEKR